ncbi:long-chain fatty acid transporter [Pedobacter changchengzhani]|uniref:Long-chain fatty acid transporter n=1 Tax=Pedobacter changchengzhani TaxID=2529274 RepID=A0A4R5MMA9_9SPHI|nr:outer membrane protein transport protein [Pedobacter changchengzhani]TDG36802.1 long-chain fatty acid transporter [Pedobacter changchengzhani]
MKKILLSFLLSAPIWVFGQGFQVNLQGQKQIGMAGAGSALALDEASVFYNPGAVSMLEKNSISAGVNPLLFKSAFKLTGSSNTEFVKDKIAPPFEFYAVWGPKSNKFKLGLGVYTPFGGLVDWGDNWSGRYSLTSLNLKAIYFQPTLSVKITDAIGIGAGFVYNHGEVDLQKDLPVNFPDGSPSKVQLKGTGKGYGWNAGIYVKTLSKISFGLTYRSKVITKLDNGDANFTVPSSLASSFPAGNHFNAELPLPATITLGVGIPFSPRTTLAFDASLVQWHIYKELAFDYTINTPALSDTHSPRNYRDGASFKIGIQHKATDNFTLRAGAGYAITPVQSGYVTPEAPDANRYILSAGAGYTFGSKFEVNASFLFEDLQSRQQKNIESGLDGTFKTLVYAPGLSLTYKW